MSGIPRLLPLVAVALGGVLVVKAASGLEGVPQLLSSARALAEEAPAKSVGKVSKPSPSAKSSPAKTAPAAGPTAAPVCAPSPADLAKQAGLSPAELQVLQSLGSRRTQLDQRERDLDTQLQLLAAAETKLDAKLKGLSGLKAEIQALIGQSEQKEQAETDRLVTVYSKMKPRDAGAIMATLDDKVRIPVAAKMKEAALAQVLSQMPTVEAKKLTESLAHRFEQAKQLAQNANAPAAATPPPPSVDPTAPAKPAAKPARARPKPRPKGTKPAAPAATAATPSASAANTPAAAAAKPAAAPTAPSA